VERLFSGIEGAERESLMGCLQAVRRHFKKGEMVFAAGDPPAVGLLQSGAVQVLAEDPMGNRTIIGRMEAGDLFGEAFACAGAEKLPFSVEAAADSDVLLIDVKKILVTCPTACPFHSRLIENLMAILAHKNIMLGAKIRHLSRRTTRDKLLSYLSEQAREAGSRSFTIPFNRQELADYLCVDRSAMSAELSKLKAESMLDYDKNLFTLLRRTRQGGAGK
jgi:CRP/FNR family transcriptional regulator, dissimilatory nitrate respiration regulator